MRRRRSVWCFTTSWRFSSGLIAHRESGAAGVVYGSATAPLPPNSSPLLALADVDTVKHSCCITSFSRRARIS